VLAQIQDIEAALPFALQGFDCDNGAEFLNHHLLRYFTEQPRSIALTRSRPYRKNDNAMSSRKTGPMCATSLAMTDWNRQISSP